MMDRAPGRNAPLPQVGVGRRNLACTMVFVGMAWLTGLSPALYAQALDQGGELPGTDLPGSDLPGADLEAGFALPSDASPAMPLEPTLFAGSLGTALGLDTQTEDPLEDMAALHSRIDLDLRHPLAQGLRVRLAARFQHRAALGHRGDHEPAFVADWPAFGMRFDQGAELREAYVQWERPWGRLVVGRDIVQWGALELQSPLRVVNPMDYSAGVLGNLAGDDTQALADLMVRWERPVGADSGLEFVYQPFFASHRFSLIATDTAALRQDLGPSLPPALFAQLRRIDLRLDRQLGQALLLALEPPPAAPWHGSLAARGHTRLGVWDVAAVAIWNWDRLPRLDFDEDVALVLGALAGAGFGIENQLKAFADPKVTAANERLGAAGKGPEDLVQATWRRRIVLGLEAEGPLAEGWLLRADAAVSPSRVLLDDRFAPLESPLVQGGLGVEFSHEDWLVALLEWNYQWVVDVPSGRRPFLLAKHHHALAGGLVLRLGEGQPWTVQLGGMWGISLGDWAALPKVQYAWAENWTLGLGAAVAGGPVASVGGLIRQDDQVVFDVRRAF